MKKQTSRSRIAALLAATALVAAACGTDAVTDTATEAVDDASELVQNAASGGEEPPVEEVEAAPAEDEAPAEEEQAPAEEEAPVEEEEAEEEAGPLFDLEFAGLEPLGEGFVYEGWVVVDGAPISTGRFTIAEIDGEREYTAPPVATAEEAAAATDFVLSIEPAVGDDPAPADAKPLGGTIVDGVAELSIAHPAALGNDFSTASGYAEIAAPTTDDPSDDNSGVWFIEIENRAAVQGLQLPELPAGWIYEGWAVIDGQPVTTGRFLDPGAVDDFNGFSGTDGTGPPFPGEDFIQNAPEGLEFPTDLSGSTIVVSIEPEIDDSPLPFAFKPLAIEVPANTPGMTALQLGAGPGFPTGTATLAG